MMALGSSTMAALAVMPADETVASAAGLTPLEETARGLAALLGARWTGLWEVPPARPAAAAPATAAEDVAAAEAALAAWAQADAAIRTRVAAGDA